MHVVMGDQEASLEQLAAKFDDSEDEAEEVAYQVDAKAAAPAQPAPAAAADASAAAEGASASSNESDSDAFYGEDDEEDDSEEDDDLGNALDWADLSAGAEAGRGRGAVRVCGLLGTAGRLVAGCAVPGCVPACKECSG